MIIDTDGVVPEEEWIKAFRLIKNDVVGEESFINIEFGEIHNDKVASRSDTVFRY